MNIIRQLLLMPLLAVAITAFSTDSVQAQTPARDKLVADLQACTKTHGYDPQKAAGLGEHELGQNELLWRQCAYDAVHGYAQTNPDLAGQYEQLINEDITMTNAVQGGAMTRAQRRERLETLISQIEAAEKQHVAAAEANAQAEHERLQQVVTGVRGFSL
jgi:hypothetical protein